MVALAHVAGWMVLNYLPVVWLFGLVLKSFTFGVFSRSPRLVGRDCTVPVLVEVGLYRWEPGRIRHLVCACIELLLVGR